MVRFEWQITNGIDSICLERHEEVSVLPPVGTVVFFPQEDDTVVERVDLWIGRLPEYCVMLRPFHSENLDKVGLYLESGWYNEDTLEWFYRY